MNKRATYCVIGVLLTVYCLGLSSAWWKGFVSDESNVIADSRQVWRSDFWRVNIRKHYDRFVHPPLLFYLLSPASSLTDQNLLRFGRAVMLLSWFLAGWVVWKWSSELYGWKGGLLSTILYAFSPTPLAHAGIVVNNMLVCATSLLSMYLFWFSLRNGGVRRVLLWGMSLGLAMLSKFTAGVLYPSFALCALIALLKGGGISGFGRARWFSTLCALFVGFLVSILVFDSAYRFEGCFRTMSDYKPQSRTFRALMPILTRVPIPIPAPVIVGTDWQTAQIGEWGSPEYFDYYLLGRFSERGWKYFFTLAFLIKSPVPFLIFAGLALFSLPRREEDKFSRSVLLIPALFLLLGLSFFYHAFLTIGYVLLLYPVLSLYAGRVLSFRNRFLLGFLCALAVWQVYASISSYPDYLTYSNELAGGKRYGWKYYMGFYEWSSDVYKIKRYLKKLREPIEILYNNHLGDRGGGWRFVSGSFNSSTQTEVIERYLESGRPPLERMHNVVACDIPYFDSGLLGIGVMELVGSTEIQSLSFRWLRENFEPVELIGGTFLIFRVSEKGIEKLAERDWLNRLAYAHYLWRRRSPSAEEYFKSLPDGYFPVHFYRSLFYHETGKPERALDEARKALGITKGEEHFRLAFVFSELQENELSTLEYIRGFLETPFNLFVQLKFFRQDATVATALLKAINYEFEDAISILTPLLPHHKYSWLLYADKAYFHLQLGERGEGLDSLQKALRLRPDFSALKSVLKKLQD